MYEAAPGHFIPVGTTMEQHREADGANYRGDDWERTYASLRRLNAPRRRHPITDPDLTKLCDIRRVWITARWKGIAYDKLTLDHLLNIVGFLKERRIEISDRFPNLSTEIKRRGITV